MPQGRRAPRRRRSHHRLPLGTRRRVGSLRHHPGSRLLRQGHRRRFSRRRVRRTGRADESRRAGRTGLSGRNAQRESRRHARGPRDAAVDGRPRRLDEARTADSGVHRRPVDAARHDRAAPRSRAPCVDFLDSPARARQPSGGRTRFLPATPNGTRGSFTACSRAACIFPPSSYEVCFLSMAHDDRTLAMAADAIADAAAGDRA